MFKKILAAAAVVATLLLAAPTAANADPYTNGSPCQFDVNVVQSGDTATLICVPGTWASSEIVDWTATGEDGTSIRLVAFKAVTSSIHFAKNAAADGSDVLKVTLPSDAVGLYTVVGHGRTSDHTCPASLTVIPADHPASVSGQSSSNSDLPNTGSIIAGWAAWSAAGLLVLGLLVLAIAFWARRVRSH